MEFTWRKMAAIALIVMGIIIIPIFLISNPMLDWYVARVNKNPNSGFSKWLLMNSAGTCYKTLRPERSAEMYFRYMELYPDDPERPFVLMRYAMSLEDSNQNANAIAAYQQFMNEYPDLPEKRDAEQAIDRIKYVKPNR